MTEREKMLRGDYYNSRDPELLELYHKAKDLLKQFNHLDSTALDKRDELLTQLFGRKGEKVWVEPPFYCDYGNNIFLGENTFINTHCLFLDDNLIKIGKNGLIAPYVQIYTAAHPLKASERITGSGYLTSSQPVEIGDNVWIGGNTVIMPGVKIGHNVTIGASSLVTKNLPDNVLAFGSPCRIIKEL